MGQKETIKDSISDFLLKRQHDKLEKIVKETKSDAAIAWFKGLPETGDIETADFETVQADVKEEIHKCCEAHNPYVYIANAARRAPQLKFATHVPKGLHPDAKGSSVNAHGCSLEHPDDLVTTKTSAHHVPLDVAGNAAALDVAAFLEIKIGDESLVDLFFRRDPDLMTALPGTHDEKEAWAEAFSGMLRIQGRPFVDALMPQIYFPTSKGEYHGLAPCSPSGLIHAAYERIQSDLFSDETKAAREARKQKKSHPHGVRDYPKMAIQKMGGSKPQNISKLNAARRGDNILLASLPPQWGIKSFRVPWGTQSVFDRILAWRAKEPLESFRNLLKSTSNNMDIRAKREAWVMAIVNELIAYSVECWAEKPGWSDSPKCKLNESEKIWFDYKFYMDRAKTIEEQHALYGKMQLAIENISDDFARWLNKALKHDGLGDPEQRAWEKVVRHELASILHELEFTP